MLHRTLGSALTRRERWLKPAGKPLGTGGKTRERVSQGIDRPLAHFEEKADGMCDFCH